MELAALLAVVPLALQEGQEAAPAAAPAAARVVAGYESVAPSDTLFFVGIDSVDELLAEWRASAHGRMVGDEAAAPLRDAFAALLEALAQSSKEELGVDVMELARMIDGRAGVAVGGDLFGESKGHAFLALESSQHAAELLAGATALAQKSVERGEAVLKSETVGAREVVQVTPLAEHDKGSFQIAGTGTTLAVGTAVGSGATSDWFARVLQGLDGEAGETLGASPAFLRSLAAKPGGIKLFLDSGAAIRARLEPAGPDGDERPEMRTQRTLGLDQLGALAARLRLDAAEMRLEAHQAWTPVGLAKVLMAFMNGGDHQLLKLLPVDAEMAFSLQLDLPSGLDAANALAVELGGRPLFGAPAAEGSAPAAAEADAFEPRRDLLDHLDGRLALTMVAVPPEESLMGMGLQGGPSMNLAVAVGVKNAAALAASIDKLLRSQGLHAARRKSEFEGYVIYTLPMPPVPVSYAIVDDFIVVSPSATLLQDMLRRKSNVELPNLRSSPGFTANFDALSTAPAFLLWASNSTELLDSISNSMRTPEIDPGYTEGDEEGDGEEDGEEDGGAGFGEEADDGSAGAEEHEPAVDPVERAMQSFLAALEQLDPALLKKHMPAGSIGGISCDQGGIRLEVVAR